MDTLRIKCPSCGIVLEVRNSKNEQVKRIACPNCKKQLAVNFKDANDSISVLSVAALYEGKIRYQLHEGINPIPHVASGMLELRVVRINSGEWKCILRALTDENSTMVNNLPLYKDDEVVLQRGDEIEVSGILLSFDKPGREPVRQDQEELASPAVSETRPKEKRSSFLFVVIAVLLAIIAVAWNLTSVHHAESSPATLVDTVVTTRDTLKPVAGKPTSEKVLRTTSKKANDNIQSAPPSPKTATDDFSLEMRASKGDVKAQYQIGMRWVTSNDCSDVVKGVRYLEVAARHGYNQAQYALGIIYHKGSPSCGIYRNLELSRQYMQQASRHGNAKAKRFLESNYVE